MSQAQKLRSHAIIDSDSSKGRSIGGNLLRKPIEKQRNVQVLVSTIANVAAHSRAGYLEEAVKEAHLISKSDMNTSTLHVPNTHDFSKELHEEHNPSNQGSELPGSNVDKQPPIGEDEEEDLEEHQVVELNKEEAKLMENDLRRTIAWMKHIQRFHSNNPVWHISVDSIVLETKGKNKIVMQVMHDINNQTQEFHVKTNLVHTLYRVQTYGLLLLEKFVELLRPSECKQCAKALLKKTWYTAPLKEFTSFIFCQEISIAADHALRMYNENAALEEKTEEKATEAMRVGATEKTNKLMAKMIKYVSIANLAHSKEFLEEVGCCFYSC